MSANPLELFSAYAGLGRVKAAQGKRQEAIDRYKRAQASVPLPDYAAALHARANSSRYHSRGVSTRA
jgi:hypothetical protein